MVNHGLNTMNQATGWVLLSVVVVAMTWVLWPQGASSVETADLRPQTASSTDTGAAPTISVKQPAKFGASVPLLGVDPDKLVSNLSRSEKHSFCETLLLLFGGEGRRIPCGEDGKVQWRVIRPLSDCLAADLTRCNVSARDYFSCSELKAAGFCVRDRYGTYPPCNKIPKSCLW